MCESVCLFKSTIDLIFEQKRVHRENENECNLSNHEMPKLQGPVATNFVLGFGFGRKEITFITFLKADIYRKSQFYFSC